MNHRQAPNGDVLDRDRLVVEMVGTTGAAPRLDQQTTRSSHLESMEHGRSSLSLDERVPCSINEKIFDVGPLVKAAGCKGRHDKGDNEGWLPMVCLSVVMVLIKRRISMIDECIS